jgi:predicted  nucleic acid-binding Zn-ribbon protein
MSPLGKEEAGSAQGTTTDDTTNAATIEQLELDLELLDLAAHRKVSVEETGHNPDHEILQKSSPDVHYPGEQTVEDQNLDAISKLKVSDVEDVQGERDLQSIQKHQKMGSDDEPEASAIITSLQEELMKLKPQLQLGEQREAVAKNTATELVTELQNVQLVVEADQRQESESPANSLSRQKDVEARALQNWEVATTRLLEYLNEGDHALTEAVNEMEGLRSESLLLGDASPSRMHLKLMMTSPSPSRMHFKHMMMTSPSPSRMQLKHMMTSPSPSPQAVAPGSKGKGSVTDHQGLEKKLNVCSVLLSWLSEKMATDSSAKVELNCVEEKRSLLSSFENDHQVDPSNALLKEADSKTEVEIYVQTPLLENKGTSSLGLSTLFDGVQQSQSETDLAQMRGEISNLKVELMGCETKRERLAMEKNELALKLERTEEMWNKSSMVLSTLVCWSLDCRVADQEVQRLKTAEFDASLQERDNQITGLRSDIEKSAAQVREHMHEFELLLSHNQRWMLDLDEARKEIINKDQALLEMQNELMKVQEELVQCEDQRLRLDVEKGKLEIQVTESGEALEALREKVTLITEQLQVSEGKVVEMTTTQAAMAIAQENWALQKEGLESHAKEVEEKSRNLEEELEAARIELYTIQAQLSEAESQKTTLFQEGNRVAAELEDEIQAWKHCAEERDREVFVIFIPMMLSTQSS